LKVKFLVRLSIAQSLYDYLRSRGEFSNIRIDDVAL
jgi:hypothetical protein